MKVYDYKVMLAKYHYALKKGKTQKNARQLLNLQVRAARALGLIEQAHSATNELEMLNAYANFKANLKNRCNDVTLADKWFDAVNSKLFAKVTRYAERDHATFTVGDYLDLLEKFSAEGTKKDAITDAPRSKDCVESVSQKETKSQWAV